MGGQNKLCVASLRVKHTIMCHNPCFASPSACRDALFTVFSLHCLTLSIQIYLYILVAFKNCRSLSTVRPVVDVTFALCQAFYIGINLFKFTAMSQFRFLLTQCYMICFFNYIIRITILYR